MPTEPVEETPVGSATFAIKIPTEPKEVVPTTPSSNTLLVPAVVSSPRVEVAETPVTAKIALPKPPQPSAPHVP